MTSSKVKENNRLTFAIIGFSLMATTSFAAQNWSNVDQNKNNQQSNNNNQNWKDQQSDNNNKSWGNQQSAKNNQANSRQSNDEAVIKKLKDLGYWDKNAKLIAQEMNAKNVNALKAVQNLNDRRGKGDDIPIHQKDKLEDIK